MKDNNFRKIKEVDCDTVLLSGGWSPVVHLLSHRGIRPIWDKQNACFLPNKNFTVFIPYLTAL